MKVGQEHKAAEQGELLVHVLAGAEACSERDNQFCTRNKVREEWGMKRRFQSRPLVTECVG